VDGDFHVRAERREILDHLQVRVLHGRREGRPAVNDAVDVELLDGALAHDPLDLFQVAVEARGVEL